MEAVRLGRILAITAGAAVIGTLYKPDSTVRPSSVHGAGCQTQSLIGTYHSPDGLGTFQQAVTVCEGETCPPTVTFRSREPMQVSLAEEKPSFCRQP